MSPYILACAEFHFNSQKVLHRNLETPPWGVMKILSGKIENTCCACGALLCWGGGGRGP